MACALCGWCLNKTNNLFYFPFYILFQGSCKCTLLRPAVLAVCIVNLLLLIWCFCSDRLSDDGYGLPVGLQSRAVGVKECVYTELTEHFQVDGCAEYAPVEHLAGHVTHVQPTVPRLGAKNHQRTCQSTDTWQPNCQRIGWQWRIKLNRSISAPVDFCRNLVGKILINVCHCGTLCW